MRPSYPAQIQCRWLDRADGVGGDSDLTGPIDAAGPPLESADPQQVGCAAQLLAWRVTELLLVLVPHRATVLKPFSVPAGTFRRRDPPDLLRRGAFDRLGDIP